MHLNVSIDGDAVPLQELAELRKYIDDGRCPDIQTFDQYEVTNAGPVDLSFILEYDQIAHTAFAVVLASPVIAEFLRCVRTYLATRTPGVKVKVQKGNRRVMIDSSSL